MKSILLFSTESIPKAFVEEIEDHFGGELECADAEADVEPARDYPAQEDGV